MKLRLLFSSILCAMMFSGFSQSIGIIGSATPTGWDADTDMIQNPDSAHLWSIVIDLTAAEVKFRQDDAWDINWGAPDFPSGIGISGGPNIPIPAAGTYTVTFNSLTGAYNFEIKSDIGIIGSATPNAWASDINLAPDAIDPDQYSITLNLVVGEAKFRKDDAWDINWGAADFPSGVGTQGGPNIPIPATGKYHISFNKATGAYSFEEIISIASIALTGSGAGGADVQLTKDAGNPDLWKGNVTLVDGKVLFTANADPNLAWGDSAFPAGTATLGGPGIPVVAASYLVTFNLSTLEYTFLTIGNYSSIGIIGSATPGGWDTETPLDHDATDPSVWRTRLKCVLGEAKFRANNEWVIDWGAGDFPTGIGEQGGANIPVPAGEYKVTINTTTGVYNFEEVIVFDTISLIGNSIPGNNWDADVYMDKDPVDEYFFTIASIELIDAPGMPVTGGVKFRANHDWAINWGAIDFPAGVGTQNGHNIEPVAGTYRVTFNTSTGEYAFGPVSATFDILKSNAIKMSPNPTSNRVNIEITEQVLQGDVRVAIYNSLGKLVLDQNMNIQASAQINVSALPAGQYMVQLSNSKFMVGKSLVVMR